MKHNHENSDKDKLLLKLAYKVMRDRQLLQILGDRVYELMLEELRLQKERSKN
ncbi:hypothetical protein [Anabaena sp. UHCC 0399]|uniref:hypothetical protein n=1 Tax=Anabaena sp. UHCC 0399 TaxID=3110238 RepID=UPI0016896262|nr:hypothetical protein [Anabaena sp. UHCC 0399]MBD2364273.1 hypothetical protein [Anabaena minutissima FACHB-250]MEA5566071.1 hypothetical protein [Anabaena sp. UHCC 0399]